MHARLSKADGLHWLYGLYDLWDDATKSGFAEDAKALLGPPPGPPPSDQLILNKPR